MTNSWLNPFTCSSSLTLSMGATAVLEMAAAIPPAKKSFMKLITASDMAGWFLEQSPSLLGCSKLGPRSSRKPYARPSGRGTPSAVLYIWRPFIARRLSDRCAVCRTDERGWKNIRGWSSGRAPYFWIRGGRPEPGTFKGHIMCWQINTKLKFGVNNENSSIGIPLNNDGGNQVISTFQLQHNKEGVKVHLKEHT